MKIRKLRKQFRYGYYVERSFSMLDGKARFTMRRWVEGLCRKVKVRI